MPVSLENKLAGKQSEVVNAIRGGLGISGTMELYGIKSRRTFLHWLREHTNGEWQPGPLTELTGANKHKWMREHRETILDCLEIFGTERTRDMFCFTEVDTLDRFIRFSGKPFTGKLTRLERVELDNRDLKARVNHLEKRIENYDIRFAIVEESQRQLKFRQNLVDQFPEMSAELLGIKLTQGLKDNMRRRLVPALQMLPQPPDLSIDSLAEAKREAKKAREAEARAKKEAEWVAKERAKEEAEEAKKAKREAEERAKEEAELVVKEKAKREAQGQQQSFGENPLATTIARLKGEC